MILAHGVTKSFPTGWFGQGPRTAVLRGFDFEAQPGQITGLLGKNGAGKTTFFRGLTGLDPFETGVVNLDGIDPKRHPEQARGRIALLPEEPGVEPSSSGKEHLELFGTLNGLDKPRLARRIEEANNHLDMKDFWERPFRSYSKGQKARVALARIRMMESASVLVFDEPTNGLDFEAATRVHHFIRTLAQEGRTVVVASHILNDLRVLCDRLVGLSDGITATAAQVESWMAAHARADRAEALDAT